MVRLQIYILAIFLILQACSKAAQEAASSAASTAPAVGNQELPPEKNKFYVHATSAKGIDVITRLDSDWSKSCEVDLDATNASERDILCTVEIKELDLFHQGIKFQYNAPKSNKCVYLATRPYFFYHYEPKDGPTSVTKDIAADGTITITGTNVTQQGAGPVCNFNYGAFIDGAPNCCLGKAVLTTNDNTKSPVETTSTTIDWGGDPSNCIAGAAREFDLYPTTKMPAVMVTRLGGLAAEANFTGEMAVTAPIQTFFKSNVHIANYYTGTQPIGFDNPASCTKCNASAAIYTPNRYYTWWCYDEAQEVYARIRLQVREWNLASEFAKKQSGDWNLGRSTSEGVPWNTFPNNDFADWADFTRTSYIGPGL